MIEPGDIFFLALTFPVTLSILYWLLACTLVEEWHDDDTDELFALAGELGQEENLGSRKAFARRMVVPRLVIPAILREL